MSAFLYPKILSWRVSSPVIGCWFPEVRLLSSCQLFIAARADPPAMLTRMTPNCIVPTAEWTMKP